MACMDNLTILVVDDDPLVLDTTCQMVDTIANVLPASSSTAAIDILRSDVRVDVLMTDVMMYPMNGFKLAKEAQSIRPGLSVVLTSGYPADMLDIPPTCQFLPKPYRLAGLHRLLLDV